jgi:hypothetical protein
MIGLQTLDTRTLVDDLSEEQPRLTADGRFARRPECHALTAQAKLYRDLLPAGGFVIIGRRCWLEMIVLTRVNDNVRR